MYFKNNASGGIYTAQLKYVSMNKKPTRLFLMQPVDSDNNGILTAAESSVLHPTIVSHDVFTHCFTPERLLDFEEAQSYLWRGFSICRMEDFAYRNRPINLIHVCVNTVVNEQDAYRFTPSDIQAKDWAVFGVRALAVSI